MPDPQDPEAIGPPPSRPAPPDTVDFAPPTNPRPPASGGPSPLPADASPTPFGDYELLGEIERGGMGVVYRARERHSGRLVALKMMLDENAADPGDLRRFVLEARATGELQHPGVVAIHAWGEHKGHPFYTMDFIPGVPLHKLLGQGPLPVGRAVRYLVGIADAVAAAHALGIVHRDLKPGNVIIDETDRPRVLDFGLAKRRHEVEEDAPSDEVLDVVPASAPLPRTTAPQATEKGAILGTPSYMAPEQVRSERGLGPPADVYALGSIFYEMLTGRPPFQGETAYDTLTQVLQREPVKVRQLNRAVPAPGAACCYRCLAKGPDGRYPDAGALAADLEAVWQRATRGARFARLTLAGTLLIGLLLAASALFPDGLLSRVVRATPLPAAPLTEPLRAAGAELARAVEFVAFFLAPLVIEVGVVVWLAAWVWHAQRPLLVCVGWAAVFSAALGYWASSTGTADAWLLVTLSGFHAAAALGGLLARLRAPRPAARARGGEATEPYLQKLFARRVATRPKASARSLRDVPAEFADFEPGKTLHQWDGGLVYSARQKSLDRPVLLWLDTSPAAAGGPLPGVAVSHPAVLGLHVVGSGPQGRFLVTRSAAAPPLAQVLERRALQPEEAVELTARMARAVQAFHDQGACHGRLRPDWVLLHGESEPLLCPCGVPSESADDRRRDVTALAGLAEQWLPPRPRGWRRGVRAETYRACDAARAGAYERAEDFASDLELSLKAALVRWRERVAGALIGLCLVLPALACLEPWLWPIGGGSERLQVLAFWPAALLMGFVHVRALVHAVRLRSARRERLLVTGAWLGRLASAGVLVALAVGVAWAGAPRQPWAFGGLLLGLGEMLAACWFLGAWAAGLVTFVEFLFRTLRQASAPRGPEGTDVPGEGAGEASHKSAPSSKPSVG